MAIRQTRIFVPSLPPFDNFSWVETLIGSVIAPFVPQTEWFWFSRYIAPKTDGGDCNIELIPEEFGITQNPNENGTKLFKSLRFRYQVNDDQLENFESHLREAIVNHNCAISDFRDYSHLDDLGGDRFIGGERTEQRRLERANLMVKYLCDVSQIFIHCLQGPDESGRFQLESSNSDQNPHGSIFESVHHLFCNVTNVPLRILVSQNGFGTDWNPPIMAEGVRVTAFPVRF